MKKSTSKMLFSISLLLVGVVLLLINIGVISLEIKEVFVVGYPFLLLLYGLFSMYQLVIKKKKYIFFPLFILTFSILLILDRIHLLDFKFIDFWKLWPLILILFALGIWKPGQIKIEYESKDLYEKVMTKKKSFRIGELKYNKDNWSVEPMYIAHLIGDVFIDFTKGFIPDGETDIQIYAAIGEIKIIIPEDLPIHITARSKIGEVNLLHSSKDGIENELEYKSADYDDAIKKIRLRLSVKIGEINVKNV